MRAVFMLRRTLGSDSSTENASSVQKTVRYTSVHQKCAPLDSVLLRKLVSGPASLPPADDLASCWILYQAHPYMRMVHIEDIRIAMACLSQFSCLH